MPMLTAQDIYAAARTLPLPERLRLAVLILDELGLPQAASAGLDGYSDAWTEEDMTDLRRFSARCFNSQEALINEDQDGALPSLEEILKMQTTQ